MKKITLLIVGCTCIAFNTWCQTDEPKSAVKLFLNETMVYWANKSDDGKADEKLSDNQITRLYNRITQVMNETGVVELGYSSFLVIPQFQVLSVSVSEAGISQIFSAECELQLKIKRAKYGNFDGAVFYSTSKRLTGAGRTKTDAINKAVSSISENDKELVSFFEKSREKIDNYFKTNCKSVIAEAQQAYDLNDYAKSIALYFSVPSSAPCYKDAYTASKKVYIKYIEDECNQKLVLLKSYVTLAQNQNNTQKNYYDSAMNIMRNLDPASDKCYAEAKLQIDKIEQRLAEAQRREWEIIKKQSGDEAEVKKEMYKAMGKINASYQPPTNVIIAN